MHKLFNWFCHLHSCVVSCFRPPYLFSYLFHHRLRRSDPDPIGEKGKIINNRGNTRSGTAVIILKKLTQTTKDKSYAENKMAHENKISDYFKSKCGRF